MPGKSMVGDFTAQAVITMTESAQGTLTFTKLETGLSVFEKIGWVINRIVWRLSTGTHAQFNSTADYLTAALTMSNMLTALADNDPAIIAQKRWQRTDFGTAASGSIDPLDYVDDYSTLPGGGLLILPNPFYGAILDSGLSAAATVVARVFYQAIALGPDDYTNLVQSRQLLISS